jgi:DNA-binding NarL/FixJ family response regulator
MACSDCGRTVIADRLWRELPASARRVLKATHARAGARGLCGGCAERHRQAGTLIDFNPTRLTHEDIMEEYAILSRLGEGYTNPQIAARLGISRATLWRHLKKETNV